ncbi:hypothetical protein Goklo_004466 [Gossypium klotzschianum]|uniref:Reverse transcriptase domain-containing protein n=1 Tax=Gossypium klotzschianum TaxID=34286 RepID=A0A7J8VNU8_9ROSI|nr:hypothetical protein [Gossypium klotzschianum]
MSSLCENSGAEKSIADELIPKKKLVGQSSKDASNGSEGKEDFDILDGDIQKSFVNGVSSITFSDRIHQILIQGMENTVILKLLGRNIEFSILQNKIYNLWRSSAPLHMMDVENGYFLVKFQNKLDCEKALSEGPWTIFDQYLTVQPWTLTFDPTQAYPSVVMVSIRFPGLPGYLYNHKIITEIGEMVEKVVKLNMNTDSRVRRRFSRMAIYVDLEKPLVSQILTNGRKQNVKYESLSTNYFHCERYGHVESSCTFRNSGFTCEKNSDPHEKTLESQNTVVDSSGKKDENYGPWMTVERKSRRKFRENMQNSLESAFLHNGRLELSNNNNNNKGQLKEASSITSFGLTIKEKDGPNMGSRLNLNSFNENLQVTKKQTNFLGLGDNSAIQARGLIDQLGSDSVAQQSSVATGSLHLEGNAAAVLVASKMDGRDRNEVRVEVGSLDSGKHLAVVFHKSKNPNNSVPSSNNIMGLSPVDLGYSGPTFTWQRGGTFVRLDRDLANDAWIATLPILKGRPFRFLAGWTKHNDFPNFVRDKWNFADHGILQNKTVEFFERLYGEAPLVLRDISNNNFPCLNHSEITFLEAAITDEEIKTALPDMAPLKAPRSDGFHAHFFQSQWDILGNYVCQWVKDIFTGRSIEPDLNNTLIVLIPTKESPEDFSHFRPISLCSVLYILVMEVIAKRFKLIFPKLISQEQVGFIVGRNIFDNIILAQEVIHSMRCNRKGKKWMAIKLDLEKAYDRKFKPIRGIRQGCPLSPYLFVLCMKWLGHFIRFEMEVGNWVPIRLSRTGPAVSHLFFADDLVIFCKAQLDQAILLDSIISQFYEISGHKISVRKSNIFFSKNIGVNVRNQISQLFRFQEVQNLGTYLGVPLLHDRVTKNALNFVVDKVRQKLQSWDAKKLSLEEKITLAQSTLLSIPNYFMQLLMILKGVYADIERLIRQFIWGCTDGHPKMSLVG